VTARQHPFPPEPPVSLLLPNRDNEAVLDLFFQKLAANTTYSNVELIAADDGSTDGSVAILRRWRESGRFPSFTLLEREHSGIVPTLNAALAAAGGEIVVRLDGDATIETPGWLERMLAFQTLSDRIGVTVASVILDSGRVHTYGINVVCPEGIHDRGARLVEPIGRRTVAGELEHPMEGAAPTDASPTEVDAALGCWTMFPADLARELGGWDEAYSPVWFEDIDFSFAARVHGRKVFHLPDLRVIHRVGMRRPRVPQSRAKLALIDANRRFGRFVPDRLRAVVGERAGVGERDPVKHALLERHHAHWRAKWGFDPLNPDVDQILRTYAGTEVCWAHDEAMRRAGEELAGRYSAAMS
jgi:GT2 family glycosyltransferase